MRRCFTFDESLPLVVVVVVDDVVDADAELAFEVVVVSADDDVVALSVAAPGSQIESCQYDATKLHKKNNARR